MIKRNFKGVNSLRQLRQDYLINGVLPCIQIILRKRLLKDENHREDFIKTLKSSLFKISKHLDPKVGGDRRNFSIFLQSLVQQGIVKQDLIRQNM